MVKNSYVLPESSETPKRKLPKSRRQRLCWGKGPGAQESDRIVDVSLQALMPLPLTASQR